MTSRLLRTKLAIENCREHLTSTDSSGSEIESYLTQHILVVMCAEIQQEFYSLLEDRANEASDNELKNFALTAGKRVLRSIGKKEVAGFVGFFGTEAKNYLARNVNDREVTLYNNAISSRHDIAHSTGSNITFRELQEIVSAATNFINIVERSISTNRDPP